MGKDGESSDSEASSSDDDVEIVITKPPNKQTVSFLELTGYC